MNAKSLIASVSLLLAAGGAFAQSSAEQNEASADLAFLKPTPSTLTRAQVKADTIAAIRAGALERNEVTTDIAYEAARVKTPGVEARLAAKSGVRDRGVQ